jgi:hypothetical protein
MKKIVKFLHKHHTTIQIATNFCAILGVLVAAFQISSTKQIIQAIFQSQEKAASYKLLAMKTEIATNLEHINDALAHQDQYKNLHQVFQVPLSTTVYFSNPTYFKLDHLDKAGNHSLNVNISKIYVSWQVANNLIQSSQGLVLSANFNPGMAKVNLLRNNLKILEILEMTRQPAEEVLKAIEEEPSAI